MQNIIQRVRAFKPDEKRAKKASVNAGRNIWQVVDRNGQQVYHSDDFYYQTRAGRNLVVRIKRFGKAGQSLTVEPVTKDGTPLGEPFSLRPVNLGLSWRKAADNLEAGINAANVSRAQRKQEQAEAVARLRAAKKRVKARHSEKQIKELAAQTGVDWEALRRQRDHLIAVKVGPDTTDAEIDELCETHETTADRLKSIRLRKARAARSGIFR